MDIYIYIYNDTTDNTNDGDSALGLKTGTTCPPARTEGAPAKRSRAAESPRAPAPGPTPSLLTPFVSDGPKHLPMRRRVAVQVLSVSSSPPLLLRLGLALFAACAQAALHRVA